MAGFQQLSALILIGAHEGHSRTGTAVVATEPGHPNGTLYLSTPGTGAGVALFAKPDVQVFDRPVPGPGPVRDGPYAAVATGNDVTSCPFSANVQSADQASGSNGGTVTLNVNSPVTGKDHDMTCSGNQSVQSTGGNALVYIYGGSASFSG
jgi:hypothetical protein